MTYHPYTQITKKEDLHSTRSDTILVERIRSGFHSYEILHFIILRNSGSVLDSNGDITSEINYSTKIVVGCRRLRKRMQKLGYEIQKLGSRSNYYAALGAILARNTQREIEDLDLIGSRIRELNTDNQKSSGYQLKGLEQKINFSSN